MGELLYSRRRIDGESERKTEQEQTLASQLSARCNVPHGIVVRVQVLHVDGPGVMEYQRRLRLAYLIETCVN